MNLLLNYKKKFLKCLVSMKENNFIELPKEKFNITVELPPKSHDGDISCNAAMILSKYNKVPPIKLANIIKENFLKEFEEFEEIKIKKPGFINIKFKITFWKDFLLSVLNDKDSYGSNKSSEIKYNIEFVSANPTGPLHVGHCRGAILGDALSNLLKFNGHDVVKEYYVNDYGNQINIFALSVYNRIIEITNKVDFPNDKNLYPGDYIIDIAKKIINDKKITNFSNFESIRSLLTAASLSASMNLIKSNLKTLGILHNNFVYESELIKNNSVSNAVNNLIKDKYVYEGELPPPKGELSKDWKPRIQLIFNSTLFGDDTDRALNKEDNTWTYFAGDIGYHADKVKRNFDKLITVLGSDHSGYVKRIKGAVLAISNKKTSLDCKISQLVKLFKQGKPFKMSKRKGDYITVEDLVSEVGKDSVRFMMLNRSNDVELDFDFEKVTEKSKDNPVFYVQYAYARINSIFRLLNLDLNTNIDIDKKNFNLNKYEIEILKKILEWPKCVEISSEKLEPHRIPFFLYDLVTLFHSYWNLGKDNSDYRFVSNNKILSKPRLVLLQALSIVIINGMKILGVSTPKTM